MPDVIWYFSPTGSTPPEGSGPGYAGELRADGLDAVLVATRGLAASWTFTARALDDDLVTLAFPADAALGGSAWSGLEGPEVAPLSGVWIDREAGVGRLSISEAGTEALGVGDFNYVATVTTDGMTVSLGSGRLRVRPAPGLAGADPGPLYTTEAEIKALAPWLDDQRSSDTEPAGYVAQIRSASRWADGVARVRARKLLEAGPVRRDGFGDPIGLYGFGSLWELSDAFGEALADGGLDSTDDRLREAVSRYAIALIPGGERDPGDRARERGHAIALLLGCVLAVDLDADGSHELRLYP